MKRYVRSDTEKSTLSTSKKLERLADDEDAEVRQNVADDENTPPEVLAKLAEDVDVEVRQVVADNENTPPETLVILAKDKDKWVRFFVARNSNTPPEVLARLAKDENAYIRWEVAKNLNTPPEVLAKLAEDEDMDVKRSVANNPNTPPEVSARLTKVKNTGSHTNSKNNRWSHIIQELKNDIESGFDDPLYEMTDAGEAITSICQGVEERLNLYLEPSVQAGSGGIWIYDEDGTTLAEGIDYAGFNEDVIDMAIESRSKKEFIAKYKEYLENII